MFIGRKKELQFLNAKYKEGRKEFGVIYGRRRIGKTSLIEEFIKEKNGLLFQAKKDSLYGNLKSFSYAIGKLLNLPSSFVYASFEEAFDSLVHHVGGKRFVLAIDEFPYIVKQDDSFPSLMQSIVDHAPENFFFLISGSDISMLKEEIEKHISPLYKRRTFEMRITSLTFSESLDYLKGLTNEDKVRYLSVTSTYPYYLSAMDFSVPFEENMKRLVFSEYGAFFTLPDQLLSNSTHTQDIYNAILSAVAKRKRTVKEISEFIHEDCAKVSKYIATLLSSELLDKRETYMGTQKSHYYEIGDPMLRFWFSFVFEYADLIRKNGSIVWEERKKDIENFVAHGFEDVALLYMDEQNEKGLLEEFYPQFQNYKVEHSKLGRSIEIDGASNGRKTLLIMECKYRKSPFTQEMFRHLEESASVFPDKYERVYYLFSKSGFDPELVEKKSPNVHLLALEDIFGQ